MSDFGGPDVGGPDQGHGEVIPELTARERRRLWRQAERERRRAARRAVRYPVITRSILIWWLIFALVGATGGGTAAWVWANFNERVDRLEQELKASAGDVDAAQERLERVRDEAISRIEQALEPLRDLRVASEGVRAAGEYSSSLWVVETLDEEGMPSVGSAFTVAVEGDETLALTSWSVIRAATVQPAPDIFVSRVGSEKTRAQLWSWDPSNDMALLVFPSSETAPLQWASDEEYAKAVGATVFALAGLGGPGAVASPGRVLDQSASLIQHDAPVGDHFRGGPLVNADGHVLALVSVDYGPLGFASAEVHFAPPVGLACRAVLSCGGGVQVSRGAEGGAPPAPDAGGRD
ncbi:MAG: hypothetical protein KatS3mg008_1804 [Acidimicrobiales bacterium]|nr:MAG: hypothetical protein KatS3mg008_1804 [Acidimicrobiales bacterium]